MTSTLSLRRRDDTGATNPCNLTSTTGRVISIYLFLLIVATRNYDAFALNPSVPIARPHAAGRVAIPARPSRTTMGYRGATASGRMSSGSYDRSSGRFIFGLSMTMPDTDAGSRRDFLVRTLSMALFPAAAAATSNPSPARARDELFKSNPLTNPVLEQIRIWNQDEADNIKYGGELTSGSSKPGAVDQYVQLLQPILAVDRDLATVDELVHVKGGGIVSEYSRAFRLADEIMSNSAFDKLQFKKNFNAFADNIYFSDPDRANLYLGGGAVPKSTQTLAYLLRNNVLGHVEDLRAELAYLIKELDKVGGGGGGTVGRGDLQLDDLFSYVKNAREGMAKYLDLVPPEQLIAAKSKFSL